MENFKQNEIELSEVISGGVALVETNKGSTCGDEDWEDTVSGQIYYKCEQ